MEQLREAHDVDASVTELDASKEREAEKAALRIKRGQHWLDWLTVGEGLVVGRQKAMRSAGTNQTVGAKYNRAFGEWLEAHRWARDLDKATRSHAMWCADMRSELESWRETLSPNVRAALNHPTATRRRYDLAHKNRVVVESGESKTQKIERELAAMADERDAWKTRAESKGSLSDLLNGDSVESICATIAANVTPGRLAELVDALQAEVGRAIKAS